MMMIIIFHINHDDDDDDIFYFESIIFMTMMMIIHFSDYRMTLRRKTAEWWLGGKRLKPNNLDQNCFCFYSERSQQEKS